MPAPAAAQVKALVNSSYNRVAPALSQTLNAELGSILKSIPTLKGQNIAPISQAIAESASKDILKSLGSIHDVRDISKVITVETIRNVEANEAVNPGLEDIDLEGIFKQINKRAEEIAKQNGLSEHAALQGISDTLDLPQKGAEETALVSKEAEIYAREEHLIGTGETAESLKKHSKEIAEAYHNEFANQAALLMGGRSAPTLEQLRKAKEEAYNRAYSAIVANLNKTSKYQEHLRDFSQNVMPMLGYKPLSPREEEELGVGAAEPNLTSFIRKTKFSATGVGLALTTSPRAQKEAFYSLLTHNQTQFEADYKEVSNQVKQFSESRGSLTHNQRKAYVDARKRYAILRNARSFSENNPGKVATYIDTFQSMEAGYRANWAGRMARATLNTFTGRVPGVHMPVMSQQVRDSFMSKRFFGGLAFRKGSSSLGSAKGLGQLAQGAKMANPELMIANKALGWGKKFVALNLAGLFGLGMYFLALGKAVFMGFMIGAMAGGTVGAIAGGIIGFQIGLALAPFTFGLSIPIFTGLGIMVGGAAGAFLGGVAGGFIAYGLHTGGATAIMTGTGVGVGGVVGGVAGGIIGGALVGAIPVIGPVLAPLGVLVGATVGAYVGAAVGGYAGYLYGHYVVGTIGAQATGALTGAAIGTLIAPGIGTVIGAGIGWLISGGWVTVKNFFAGAFAGTTATAGGILGAITGAAAAVWSGLSGAGGAVLGFLGNVGGAIWGGLGGVGVSASTALTPVAATFGAITTVGLIGGTITAATFFNPEPGDGQFTPGITENQFFTLEKTAEPNRILDETQLPSQITFTIKLEAKEQDLTDINISDQLRIEGQNSPPPPSTDNEGRPISAPCGGFTAETLPARTSWTCTYTITADISWLNTSVINTVTVRANPPIPFDTVTDSTTAIVPIGNPPECAPDGIPLNSPWKLTSEFGPSHPLGVDIADGTGTTILSTFPCSATVVYADWLDPRGSDGYGYAVILQSGPYETISGHMDRITVSVGDQIPPYGQIGPLGDTGFSFGAHVHYEVHVDGALANPHDYGIPNVPLNTYQ